jgi:pilus assembly protein FimV
VVKQYTENQYDDDLTVGTDDYDDSYYTGSVDLFEFSNDEDSPISRLKSLILSIDWEITDEVLMQFNEELVDLKDIWAGKKINLIYVQALEKISKYIYQKKADSHPSAIKLLLTLYHNLEKIVSSSDLTEEQKKEILLEDVKRFESLKRHISQQAESIDNGQLTQSKPEKQTDILGDHDLLNLKAIVLGIDWEITDEDLNQLRQEVVRLEEKFADSKPRLILLQGIGALGTYIKLKKSNAHSDAFKILHLFYESLEKIVATPMNLKEEKAILFPAVEKFNAFKNLLGPTITPEAIDRSKNEIEENDSPSDSVITPAFADFPEDVMGFQADEEVKSLGIEASDNVDNHVESFFMGSSFQNPETALPSEASAFSEDQAIALQGVDVELDDEDDERSPIQNNNPTPALSEKIVEEPYPAFQEDESVGDTEQDIERPVENTEDISIALESMLEENEKTGLDFSKLDKDIVLQGVDVETEADDDSDEEALPMMEGQLAPALAENDEVSMFNAGIFENSSETRIVDEEIEGTLGGFFDEEIDSHLSAAPKVEDNEDLDIFSTMDDPELDDSKTELSNNSFSDFGLEKNETEDEKEIKLEEDDFTPLVAEGIFSTPIDENFEFFGTEKEPESGKDEDDEQVDDNSIAAISELEQDENADTSFDESDFERPAEEIGSNIFTDDSELALSQDEEQENSEIDEQLDSFFDLREDEEENKEENTLFSTSPEIIEEDQEIEEEVVFELAEDGQISPVEPEIDENEDAYPEELETTENEDSVQVLVSEDDDAADGDAHSLPELEKDVPLTVFGKLGICVDSLGVELDDKVVQGLWEEINNLRQSFIDKPLEKTFLQLLFTVVKHIDQNRYDSSTDAYVLLKSICNALYDLQDNDLQHNQEMLFKETEKVLTWQEDILAEQTAKNEAELTIDGTAIIAQEDVNSDFNDLAQKYEQQPVDEEYESDLLSYSTDGNGFTDELDKSSDRKDTKMLHSDLKQEISMLRQTLQDEIAELRKELKGKYLS